MDGQHKHVSLAGLSLSSDERSLGSLFGAVRGRRQDARSSVPHEGNTFLSILQHQDQLWGPASLLANGKGALFCSG
jgi:hypothetical protein